MDKDAIKSLIFKLFEKYKFVRRTILGFLFVVLLWLTGTAVHQLVQSGKVDTNLTQIILGYIGVFGTLVSFYTYGRTRDESLSSTSTKNAKQDKQNEHKNDNVE